MKIVYGDHPEKGKLKQYIVQKREDLTRMLIVDPDHQYEYQAALQVLDDITNICNERKRY